jgi:Do/DeqQ family serine protease
MPLNRFRLSALIILSLVCLLAGLGGVSAHQDHRETPIVSAVRTASPAVVNISSEQEVRKRFSPFGGPTGDPLFDSFFRDFFDPGYEQRYTRSSLGSGVIIDGHEGYILTNAHVVANAGKITVSLIDQRSYSANIIGVDPESDLALLRIDSPNTLPQLPMGLSSDLMIGETVIAIGNPFGFSHTVTTGVISALNRSIRTEDKTYHKFIQTDASINPGNSGGPLLNINGDLIGINTAIYAKAQGIGFAIPIERARRIVADLVVHGEVIPAWIGVQVQNITQNLAAYYNLEDQKGVLISKVIPDSPAHMADMREGDVLLAIDGLPLNTREDYRLALKSTASQQTIRFTIWRQSATLTIAVTTTVFPSAKAPDLAYSLFGIKVDANTSVLRRRFRLRTDAGVVIQEVRQDSYFAEIGVRPGDLIRQIDDTPTNSVDAFNKAVIKCHLKSAVSVLIQRAGQLYHVTVEL